MKRSMVARLAWVQTLVTSAALAAVVLATWTGVSLLLARQSERMLEDILARTMAYLSAASEAKSIDWPWLAAEINEIRRRHVRFELREKAGARTLIELGAGAVPAAVRDGCIDHVDHRVCVRSSARYVAIAASDHAVDRGVRNELIWPLALACALAGVGVALASVAVTRRALRPLSELAARVAAVEPGSGEQLQPLAAPRELQVLDERFADLVRRYDEALLREKQFTAHASHELRTPLTVARAEIECLPHSGAAQAALARLEALIAGLLWFARAQVPLQREATELVNFADVSFYAGTARDLEESCAQ